MLALVAGRWRPSGEEFGRRANLDRCGRQAPTVLGQLIKPDLAVFSSFCRHIRDIVLAGSRVIEVGETILVKRWRSEVKNDLGVG